MPPPDYGNYMNLLFVAASAAADQASKLAATIGVALAFVVILVKFVMMMFRKKQ